MTRMRLGKADLHIHSTADDGLATPKEILDYAENQTNLDLIAITDHDAIDGALEAQELAIKGNYRVQVIVGMEITTRDGHLLALDIRRPIRMLLDMETTIALVHEQGGFCLIPHPLAWFSLGARQSLINRLTQGPAGPSTPDGLEVFNPSYAGRVVFAKVYELNETRWHLARCAGSDSHALHTIGSAYTIFPLEESPTAGPTLTQEDAWSRRRALITALRRALATKTTDFHGSFWTMDDHLSIAVPQMIRSMLLTPGARVRRTLNWLHAERHAPYK